jgi:hypothetical protein
MSSLTMTCLRFFILIIIISEIVQKLTEFQRRSMASVNMGGDVIGV